MTNPAIVTTAATYNLMGMRESIGKEERGSRPSLLTCQLPGEDIRRKQLRNNTNRCGEPTDLYDHSSVTSSNNSAQGWVSLSGSQASLWLNDAPLVSCPLISAMC